MAKKGLTVDTNNLKKAQEELEQYLIEFWEARNEIATLLDELVEADWRNTNSRKFVRHYKSGQERMDADLKSLEKAVLVHMITAINEYTALTKDVNNYFQHEFWKD